MLDKILIIYIIFQVILVLDVISCKFWEMTFMHPKAARWAFKNSYLMGSFLKLKYYFYFFENLWANKRVSNEYLFLQHNFGLILSILFMLKK